MILDFINSDGTFFRNVVFFGLDIVTYSNGILDKTHKMHPSTHRFIWRWKNDR
jgi:hypothetical protein